MDTFSRYCFNLYFGDGGDMTFKQLKKQNKELQERLNLANNTIANYTECFGTMCENYESQLKVQDNELKRRLTIIHYLETKCMKGFED